MAKLTRKITVLLLVASIAGISISFLLLKEDVFSTAHTLTVYFPAKFGVTPAATDSGGTYLGWFISTVQIVGAAIAFSKDYPIPIRIAAGTVLVLAIPFDAWTDIVYRSGYLQGNIYIATVTTIAFYTFGSEIMQGLSWALFLNTWRQALADIMWGTAYGFNSLSTIGVEWTNFMNAAKNLANREATSRIKVRGTPQSYNATTTRATYPSRTTGFTKTANTSAEIRGMFEPEYVDDDKL